MSKIKRVATLALMVAALISATTTFAQTAEPNATAEMDDARSVVLDAMHSLLTDSYHYASTSQIISSYTGSDNQTQTVVNVTSADGDVGPKGDNDIMLTSAAGVTVEAARSGPQAEFERIVTDGVTYINVSDALKQAVPQIEVDSGWYQLDDLLANIDSGPIQAGIQNLADVALPSKLVVADKLVLDVTEAPSETVDDVEARVFDVKFDAAALSMSQMPGSMLDRLKELYQNRRLYAASIFEYTAHVWIDADNGKLIKLHVDGHTYLPYLTASSEAGLSGTPGYDIDLKISSDVTLTKYGEPVEIKAPTLVAE